MPSPARVLLTGSITQATLNTYLNVFTVRPLPHTQYRLAGVSSGNSAPASGLNLERSGTELGFEMARFSVFQQTRKQVLYRRFYQRLAARLALSVAVKRPVQHQRGEPMSGGPGGNRSLLGVNCQATRSLE